MSLQDTVTDDLIAYCLSNPGRLNAIRSGSITFRIQDRHLLTATVEVEERVGHEIDRIQLEQIIDKIKRRPAT